jgi:hypothetical protein
MNPDGTCVEYAVQPGEGCWAIASKHNMSPADIEAANESTWGWNGCSGLQAGARICLSLGYVFFEIFGPSSINCDGQAGMFFIPPSFTHTSPNWTNKV